MATLKFKVYVPVGCVESLGAAAGFDAAAAMRGQNVREAAPRRSDACSSSIKLVEMPFALRPMLPSDATHLLRGMRQLMSKESLFMRFMRPVDGLSASELAYLTDLDYWDRFAWVLGIILPATCMTPSAAAEASVGASPDLREVGIAVARYIRVQDPGCGSYNAVRSDPHCAEASLQTIASSLEGMLRAPSAQTPQPDKQTTHSDIGDSIAGDAVGKLGVHLDVGSSLAAATHGASHTALLKGTRRPGGPHTQHASSAAATSLPAHRSNVPGRLSLAISPAASNEAIAASPPTPRGKSASATAELAVTVADSFHQCGFATLLLWALSQVAQRHGMRHFVGVSHEDNYKVSGKQCALLLVGWWLLDALNRALKRAHPISLLRRFEA